VSTESEDERIARWERDEARRAAAHRRRMRWWKHAREYVVMRSFIRAGLIKRQPEKLPDHPPWSHDRNWWPRVQHWSRTRTS
jgi:hypothetical protein